MKFSVKVTLKKDVLDPQGKVVEHTLKNMGMDTLKTVRQGNENTTGWIDVHKSWSDQLYKVIEEHPAVQFIWVNYCGDDFPKLPNLFSKDEIS